jgi:hypothetical protein
VTSRRVDNLGPALSFNNPGTLLRGTVSLTATATDGAGVTNVTFQHRVSPSGTWTNSCAADTTSPYSCSLNTTTLTSGTAYDFRATSVDTLGHTTTSPTYTATVDNTAPTATDVQAVNGTGTAGRIDSGDTLTFTYSESMAPASLLAGWDGSGIAVNVHVTNSGTADLLSVYDGANTTKVNLTGTTDLQLKANKVTATARLNATMTMSGSQVVITIGSLVSGTMATANTAVAMTWTPSASATDLAGNAGSTTIRNETGTTDVDF